MLEALKALAAGILKDEPVLVRGALVAAVVGVASALGIVVPTAGAEQVAAYVVIVLAGAISSRKKVTPS